MQETIHILAIVLGTVIAPLFYIVSVFYKRTFEKVIIQWRKPQLVIYTILVYMLGLTLFILSIFFIFAYWGKIEIVGLTGSQMLRLAIDQWLIILSIQLFYIGIQNFYIQYITEDGIYYQSFNVKRFRFAARSLKWESIKDYYVNSDYPVTKYTFIIQDILLWQRRKSIKVPYYVLRDFDTILDEKMHKVRRQRKLLRNSLTR